MELFVGLSGNSMEFLSLFLRDGVLGSLGSTIPKKSRILLAGSRHLSQLQGVG